MTKIIFSIPGRPTAWMRAGSSGERRFTPKKMKVAKQAISTECRRAMGTQGPITGPVRIQMMAIYAIPASWSPALKEAAQRGEIFHVSRPDLDNLEKNLLDALNGIAFMDDCQVAELMCRKRYGHPERTDVTIWHIEQLDVPATPGQRRLEARIADDKLTAAKPRRKPSAKPLTRLEEAVSRALAKDGA